MAMNKQRHYIGSFENEIDAAKAYDKYITENKINKPLNFPEGDKNE